MNSEQTYALVDQLKAEKAQNAALRLEIESYDHIVRDEMTDDQLHIAALEAELKECRTVGDAQDGEIEKLEASLATSRTVNSDNVLVQSNYAQLNDKLAVKITMLAAKNKQLEEELENAYAFEDEPNLSIDQLIGICKAYTKLGWAVQEQAEDWLYNGRTLSEMRESGAINGNALAMIVEWMTRNLSDDIVQDSEGLVDEANAFLMGDEEE